MRSVSGSTGQKPKFAPEGGLVTALSASTCEWNLIVACDMPCVSAEFLTLLLEAARDSEAQCVLPVTADGRRHPMCAIYRRSANSLLKDAVQIGTHKLQTAIQELQIHEFPVLATDILINVNTPADWIAFQNAAH